MRGGVEALIKFINSGDPLFGMKHLPFGFEDILRWVAEGLNIDEMLEKQAEAKKAAFANSSYKPSPPAAGDIIKILYQIEGFLQDGNTVYKP